MCIGLPSAVARRPRRDAKPSMIERPRNPPCGPAHPGLRATAEGVELSFPRNRGRRRGGRSGAPRGSARIVSPLRCSKPIPIRSRTPRSSQSERDASSSGGLISRASSLHRQLVGMFGNQMGQDGFLIAVVYLRVRENAPRFIVVGGMGDLVFL